MSQNVLVGFGFWRSIFEPLLPDPAWFVDEQWNTSESQQVTEYLRQGRQLNFWAGSSWCRFNCQGANMGASDLTDGTYCWPEGLVHYLEKHQIKLPDEIVSHILSQRTFPSAYARQVEEQRPIDMSWWLKQKGWKDNIIHFTKCSETADKDLLRRLDHNLIDFGPETKEAKDARQQIIERIRGRRQ